MQGDPGEDDACAVHARWTRRLARLLLARRHLGTWGLCLLFLARTVLGSGESVEPGPPDRWVFVFVMSYDNDLAEFGSPILEALERGAKGTSHVVTVLHDDPDREGLRRHVLTGAGRATEVLATDDSASEEVLREHLAWVARTYPSTRHAVVFLDHGGRLDEMCRDDDGAARRSGRWLHARRVAPVLEAWRTACGGTVDLLFLQQCGRGSLENVWAFRGCADHLLVSQTDVGTPNTWYEAALRWLAEAQEATGRTLARKILDEDRDYTDYACVDARALADLPGRLDAVLAPLLPKGKAPARPEGLEPCYARAGETFFDLGLWLRGAYRQAGLAGGGLAPFEAWLSGTLVVEHASRGERAKPWCGLSLFVPEDGLPEAYRDHPLYAASTLDDLWRLGDAPSR